jgi:hypothetical protein
MYESLANSCNVLEFSLKDSGLGFLDARRPFSQGTRIPFYINRSIEYLLKGKPLGFNFFS